MMDQFLVANFVNWQRQNAGPVGHKSLVAAIPGPNVFQGAGEIQLLEIMEVTGQANIERVAPAVNDAGAWKQGRNYAEVKEIVECLVGYAGGFLVRFGNLFEIAGGQFPGGAFVGQHRGVIKRGLSCPRQPDAKTRNLADFSGPDNLGVAGE